MCRNIICIYLLFALYCNMDTSWTQSGALVNLTNNHGNTGLHEAVRGGHVQLVELLLHRGALVHMRNKRQRTALDCAHETAGKVCVYLHFFLSQNTNLSQKVMINLYCYASLEHRDSETPAESLC